MRIPVVDLPPIAGCIPITLYSLSWPASWIAFFFYVGAANPDIKEKGSGHAGLDHTNAGGPSFA